MQIINDQMDQLKLLEHGYHKSVLHKKAKTLDLKPNNPKPDTGMKIHQQRSMLDKTQNDDQ